MNWVGGARSRIRQQSERKTQKEFFERRRLQKRVGNARPPSPGEAHAKTVISQDLLLLQTLAHVHNAKQTERDASRHVQAVNLDAKKPAFQQKMDLELPMSPIEKPSYLDLMDTSNVSLYHDLPRASTEKIPHPHPHFYTSSKFGVGSDEATNRDPGMAGMSAHSHPHLQRPQGDRSVLEESKHHFEARRKQDKHPAIRQNLDSETPFKFRGAKLPNVTAPALPLDGKSDLLAFHRTQASDRNAIQRAHRLDREENASSHQSAAILESRVACPSKSGTGGHDCNDQAPHCSQDKKTKPPSPPGPTFQKHNKRQHESKMVTKECVLTDGLQHHAKKGHVEEEKDGHCTRGDTTFNESILRPLVERLPRRPPVQATTPSLQMQLGLKALDKPMSTFEKMVMFFEKAETRAHKPHPKEHSASVHHEGWRNFACQSRSEQKGSALTTNDLTILTERPIPPVVTTKKQGNRLLPHKTNDYSSMEHKRLKNSSVLEELMHLEYTPCCPIDEDVLASQDVTFPLEASENPIGRREEYVPISKVLAANDGDKEQIRKGSIDTAELLGCEQPAQEEDGLKDSHREQPAGSDDISDVCIQAEPSCATGHRDASCDLQPGSSRHPPLPREPTTSEACTQTEGRVGDEGASRVQCAETLLEPCGVLHGVGGHSAVRDRVARDATAGDSTVQRKEAAVQVCDPRMHALRDQLSALEADLARAQSTVIWQSVMLRCLNYQ